jgi:hypothetical protein
MRRTLTIRIDDYGFKQCWVSESFVSCIVQHCWLCHTVWILTYLTSKIFAHCGVSVPSEAMYLAGVDAWDMYKHNIGLFTEIPDGH